MLFSVNRFILQNYQDFTDVSEVDPLDCFLLPRGQFRIESDVIALKGAYGNTNDNIESLKALAVATLNSSFGSIGGHLNHLMV